MANLIFKKGSSANFTSLTNNKGLSEGSFYWTEDDNRLFLGISGDSYIEITHNAIKSEFLQLLNNLATEIDSCVCDIEKSSTGHGIVVSFKGLDAKTIELDIPANAYRVKVTARDASKKAYLTGAINANNNPQALVRDSDIYMDTTAGSLHASAMSATTFKGDLEGTASRALVAENATSDHMGNIITDTYLSEASLTDHNLVMISPIENGESAKSFTLVIPDERVKTETNNSIRIYLTGTTGTDEAIGSQYLNSAIYADKDGASAKLVAPKFDGIATKAAADDLGNTISATYYNQAEINGWQLKLGTPSSSTANTLTLPQHSKATSTTLGLVKIGFTESGKKYPVELNSDGQMFVEVPWTDTVLTDHNTTYTFEDVADGWKVTASDGSQTFTHKDKSYDKATSTAFGLVKVGFTESGKNYPVELNADGQMFVNVPWQNTWVDTNTTYTFEQTSTGWKVVDSDGDDTFTYIDKDTTYTHLPNPNLLTIKVNGNTAISYDGSSTGTLNLTAGTNVQISKDSSNNITFSSTDTNTTYTLSGAADSEGYDIALAGSDGSASSAHINIANDTTLGLVKTGFQQSERNYPVETNTAGQMFVNVPWTDTKVEDTNTTYTIGGSNNASGYQIELNDDVTGGDSSHIIPKASDTSFGVIKTGFTNNATAHNYAVKLDATNGKAYVGVPVDTALSSTSTNAVENKAVTAKTTELEQKDAELNTAITNLTESLETTNGKLANAFDDVSWTQSTGVLAFNTIDSTTTKDSITINAATTETQGLMSAADKEKLDGIATGANKITVDSTLNSTSTNPVQNKVIYNRINTVEDNSLVDVSINNHTLTFEFGSGSNPKEIVIPDNNTTYTAGPWLELTGTQFKHGVASGINEDGVTVGQADNVSGWNKTFTVPSVTIDAYGHVTAASESTITIPANPNVDTKMKQTASTANASYPLLASNSTNPNGSAAEGIYNTGVTINPSTKKITAAAFIGNLEGNATTATSATKAQKDNLDNIIDTTYAANLEGSATATTYDLDLQTLHAVSLNQVSVPGATTTLAGLMTATDKVKLNGIATGANKTTVDSSLSTTSTNPVQNKVIATAINNINTSIEDINEDYVSDVSYNSTTHKLSYTKNGTSTDVVAIPKLDNNNKISLDYLPDGAISKLHVVASKDAAKKLTKSQVQNGDTVLVDDADKIMYYIVDDTKLSADGTTAISDANFALAFKEYSAGLAEKADRDSLGNSISGTYISSITASSRNITYKTQADVAAGGEGTTITIADTRVGQTKRTTDGEFPILLRGSSAGTSNTTTTTSFSSSATLNPSNGNITTAGKITATGGFTGDLTGNAATATLANKATLDASNNDIDAAYHSASITTDTDSKKVIRLSRSNGDYTDITLNGKFTDTNTTYTAGDYLTLTGTDFDHDKSGVSAGAYGTATTADGWGESVEFPTFTVDAWGHITAASTGTIKIPSNPNTDTKMNMVAHGNAKSYLLGTTTSPTSSATAVSGVADANIYISAETSDLPAQLVSENGFVGNLTGNATSATSAEKDSAGNTIATSLYDVSLTTDSNTQKILTFVRGEGEDATVVLNGKFTDTTYSAGTGLSLSGTTFNHSNNITAASVGPGSASTLSWGSKFTVPTVAYDAQGHITGAQSIEFTMPANPDTNTTYSAGTGLSLSGTTFNHKNSVTAASVGPGSGATLSWGGTFTVPSVTYDGQGHITGSGTATFTMPANPNVDTKNTAGSTLTTEKIYLVGGKTLPTASTSYSQTYANSQIFAQNGALYSEGKQVATMDYVQTYHAANMPAVTDAVSYLNTSLSGYTLTMTSLSGDAKNYTTKDIYVSKAEWTNGTSLGPVLKLSRTDSTGATAAALTATIPAATGTQSGAVTTATQTFGGQKIFADATDSTSSVSSASINTAGGISVAKTISAAQARIGDHVVLKYNATQGCLEFEFA